MPGAGVLLLLVAGRLGEASDGWLALLGGGGGGGGGGPWWVGLPRARLHYCIPGLVVVSKRYR
jgi:hypothetical protein